MEIITEIVKVILIALAFAAIYEVIVGLSRWVNQKVIRRRGLYKKTKGE